MSVPPNPQERIDAALAIIARLGGFDEAHHKQHALDMAVRALTGCPEVEQTARDARGTPYTYTTLGENEAYRAWVAAFEAGDDGSNAYRWDTGQPG